MGAGMKNDKKEWFVAWLTKKALTQGIACVRAQIESDWPRIVVYRLLGSSMDEYAYGEGRDWHRTKEGAIARAEVMRKAKIASLKRQIAKLEKLNFEDM